jgi:hypothetical protein
MTPALSLLGGPTAIILTGIVAYLIADRLINGGK